MDETFDQLKQVIEACTKSEGLTSLAMMSLPDDVRKLLNKMIRKGALPASDLASEFGLSVEQTQQLVGLLEAKGFVNSRQREGDAATVYLVRLARTRELGSSSSPQS
jgi:DNA-binding MarR family transcriptional regulator